MAGQDQGINVVIPTYKRAHHLVGKDYFRTAKYVLPESQRDDYARVLPTERMIVIPDSEDGSIARKRNWILRNIPRPMLMVDDDVRSLVYYERREYYRPQTIHMTPNEVDEFLAEGFNLADQFGCVLWGINVNTDGRGYKEYNPFSLKLVILGPFQGHLQHSLRFDERMGTKEDYDFSLQVLNKYRKILRLNKYAYVCEHGDNYGGIVSMRSMESEKKFNEAIMRKWGKEIIYYKENPESLADLLNGKVSVPIDGV